MGDRDADEPLRDVIRHSPLLTKEERSNYFSEITFFSCRGMIPFSSEEWNFKLGEWIEQPEKKQRWFYSSQRYVLYIFGMGKMFDD